MSRLKIPAITTKGESKGEEVLMKAQGHPQGRGGKAHCRPHLLKVKKKKKNLAALKLIEAIHTRPGAMHL